MDAESIAKIARKAISQFCIEECKAFCCRKGYLIMTHNEAELVTQGRLEELKQCGMITITSTGKYAMNMGVLGGCPSLVDYKCTIHKRRLRPDTCRKFPIFIEGNNIKISSRCFAAKAGLLYPFIARMKAAGYRIIQGDSYADSSIYNILPDPKEPPINPKKLEPDRSIDIQA